jgi:hypothetical protein
MLRRVDRSEAQESWLLVPQIEHGRLSGALARSWNAASLAAIEPNEELIKAIARHDDGWADWDAAPDVDPSTGRPLSFVEMPLETSIDIWRRSIYLACGLGHLAPHVVSAHFTALLQRASPRWSQDPRRFQASRQFLDEQSDHRETWLAQWQRPNPTVRTRKMADQALAYLQFFDGLSLWLCGAGRSESQTFETPEGSEIKFAPVAGTRFVVSPWPMAVPRWEASVKTRRVPVGRYIDREALAAGPSEPAELCFELVPEHEVAPENIP